MKKDTFETVVAWQKETFGKATAWSKLKHLEQELGELQEAITIDSVTQSDETEKAMRHEFADCFFLLFGAAHACGLNYEDIDKLVNDKLEINRSRNWGEPDADGVVNHKK